MSKPAAIPELAPGTIITFADLSELPSFEDAIAPLVRPDYNPVTWSHRPAIREFLKPAKFNGQISDITLEVMADPYRQLVSARERGLQLGKGSGSLDRSKTSLSTTASYLGFVFNGVARSTGRGAIGSIEAELYYYPPRLQKVAAGYSYTRQRKLASGISREYDYVTQTDHIYYRGTDVEETIKRSVTRPVLEKGKFVELDITARRIGCDVLRQALSNAISTPMQD